MICTTSSNFKKVCATKTLESVAALVELKAIVAKPNGDKLGDARAPLRIEATMPPSRRECRNECASFSRFMSAYNAASKEQQMAAGFDIISDTSKTHDAQHSTLLLTTVLMGCFGLGLLVGRRT